MRISDWSSDVCSSDLQLNLAVMNDDGTNLHTFFSQKVPAREKDNGIRFMVFPDNRRIFLGDFIVECATMLDHCENPALLPVQYPEQVAGGDDIAHRGSDMVEMGRGACGGKVCAT